MKRLTIKEFIKKANKIHIGKYDYSLVDYKNNDVKIKIICQEHGEFLQDPSNHLMGSGCFKCRNENISKKLKSNSIDFIKKATEVHKNRYDYSKTDYIFSDKKIIIICKEHGDFLQSPASHLRGAGCPKCNSENISRRCRSNIENFIQKAKEIHGNKYDYSLSNYTHNRVKIVIICNKHGKFLQNSSNHLRGNGCPKCQHQISKPETEFLDHCGVRKSNRQVFIRPYKIDGLDRKKKIIYEFLGDYWHGNPEKFKPDDFNKRCKMTFGELYSKTLNKLDNLNKMGYNIKYIWENDWKRFQKGINKKLKLQTHR